MGELRQRMGAAEFGHWQAFLAEEPIGPADQLPLWASLMAAMHNGPMLKKSKSRWVAGDFLPRMWVPQAPVKPAGMADAKAFIVAQKRARG